MSQSRFVLPILLSLGMIGFCSTASHAGTYTGGGGDIQDVSTSIFDIHVDEGNQISHFDSITFTGNHTYIGDLIFTLTHVDTGTSVTFIKDVPNGAILNGTYTFVTDLTSQSNSADSFWKAASDTIGTPSSIASGTYAAASITNIGETGVYTPTDLNVFAGEVVNGTWRLSIQDQEEGDSGHLDSWSFTTNNIVVPEAGSLALIVPALGLIGGLVLRRKK